MAHLKEHHLELYGALTSQKQSKEGNSSTNKNIKPAKTGTNQPTIIGLAEASKKFSSNSHQPLE